MKNYITSTLSHILLGFILGITTSYFFVLNNEDLVKYPQVQTSPNVSLDSLKLSTHTVIGYWEEKDVLLNDKLSWIGSSFVYNKIEKLGKTYLLLATNRHVLGLDNLAKSDDLSDSIPEILTYKLYVKFASGKEKQVQSFYHRKDDKDIAILLIDAKGLEEGKDYIIINIDNNVPVKVGDEVLAVGTPLDIKLAGTHTFGRVSAIRGDDIQFDASVTFGNSGGPLFKKETDKYSLIGINYSGVQRQDINANINFALDKKFIKKGEYKLFDVSAVGVIPAIENYYERPAKLSEFAE